MKSILGRVLVAFMLVFMSLDVCLPNDPVCVDEHSSTSEISKEKTTKTKESKEQQHHCICSLSCHNMYVEQLEAETISSALLIKKPAFTYISIFYPQITLTLEKPPTV